MILTTIIWAAVIQGLLLGVLFIGSRKYKSFANKLLGYFLLTFLFGALSDLLPYYSIGSYSIAGYFTLPEVKFLFPVLFLHFVLEKLGRSRSYQLLLKIHYYLAFFLIALTPVNVLLYLFSNQTLLDLLGWKYLEPFFLGQQYYAFIFSLFAFVIALLETRRYRNLIRNEFTDMELLRIQWLWQFILSMGLIILLWGAELIRIILGGTGQSEITTYTYLCIALFIYFVSYKAFTQHTLFDESSGASTAPNQKPVYPDTSRSALDPANCERLRNEMERMEYYLKQDLTIHTLASEIQVSARIISTCINQHFGQNFNEWVNDYRVEKALNLLKDPRHNHLSIEGIGLSSGFKSRSAMYAAFKKKTGESPGHFR